MRNVEAPSYIESIANEVLAKYRRLDSILEHAPSRGTYHEKILRDVIRNYLPSTFSTGEGFIINFDGRTSSQLDVLIVDNIDPRSFGYKDDNFFVASDIAAACFGEVKTYCKKREFEESYEKLVDTATLLSEPSGRATSFMFCYDAYATEETFRKWVEDKTKRLVDSGRYKPWHFPDYFFCLKKHVLLERETGSNYVLYNAKRRKKDSTSNVVQLLTMSYLFGCVTNGCGRLRKLQGIDLLR